MGWAWHFQQGALRLYEPLIFMVLAAASAIFAYVTGRFTRLVRLRRAAEQINLRDLSVHVRVGGHNSVAGPRA